MIREETSQEKTSGSMTKGVLIEALICKGQKTIQFIKHKETVLAYVTRKYVGAQMMSSGLFPFRLCLCIVQKSFSLCVGLPLS